MGAGGSVIQVPTDLSQAVPHDLTKSQKFVTGALKYEDIIEWLDWEFRKNDTNRVSGSSSSSSSSSSGSGGGGGGSSGGGSGRRRRTTRIRVLVGDR